MKLQSRSVVRLPMQLLSAVALVASFGYASIAASKPASLFPISRLHGRWQVGDPQAQFTTRSRPYKMIDIAPCGRDLCGVSVADNGTCGATLFRFPSGGRIINNNRRGGQATWGTQRKAVEIFDSGRDYDGGWGSIILSLGDGHDFGSRSGSMPMYDGLYKRLGAPQCLTR